MMYRLLQNLSSRLLVSNRFLRPQTVNRTLFIMPRRNTFQQLKRNNPYSFIRPCSLCLLDNNNSTTHQRWFFGVSVAFNQVDPERVRLAGPDRATAEWVLRNGGSIKWKDSPRYLGDYNLLPSTNFEQYKVEEIDLTAADVIGIGFQHLENLHHVKSIKLHGCRMIMDDAMEHIHFVKDTLERLEISRCPMITDNGLQKLHVLQKLKSLVIYDLIELKNFEESVLRLQKAMPLMEINTEDPLSKSPEDDVHKE